MIKKLKWKKNYRVKLSFILIPITLFCLLEIFLHIILISRVSRSFNVLFIHHIHFILMFLNFFRCHLIQIESIIIIALTLTLLLNICNWFFLKVLSVILLNHWFMWWLIFTMIIIIFNLFKTHFSNFWFRFTWRDWVEAAGEARNVSMLN